MTVTNKIYIAIATALMLISSSALASNNNSLQIDLNPAHYQQLAGLSPHVLQLGLKGEKYALTKHPSLVKKPYLAVVNYTKNSMQPRLWVFNLKTHELVKKVMVAHGVNSGNAYGEYFSNKMGSGQSSLGVIVTGNTYYGEYGYSLKLHGLESGINDNIFARHIVMHQAPYVTPLQAQIHHEAGKTHGCLGLNPAEAKSMVNLLKNGSVIFSYGKPEKKDSNLI